MNTRALVVSALVGWSPIGAALAAPQFVQGPSARYAHSMAYDSARHLVVLFGGNSNSNWPSGALNDTWEWNGTVWRQVATTGPSPRGHTAMVYDSRRGVCVLFGGRTGASSNSNSGETWEWDGASWSERTNVGSPGARQASSMAYDSTRHVAVLFGGIQGFALGDTWEYDGVAWSQASPSTPNPANRWNHTLVFDRSIGRIMLFGGTTRTSPLDDTWTWDGANWSQNTPSARPAARDTHGMCFANGIGASLMFAGYSGSRPGRDDTWSYSAQGWTQLTPGLHPSPRHYVTHGLVYDSARDQPVLFGGWDGTRAFGDTWTFDGSEWRPKLFYATSPVNGNRYALTPPMTWQQAQNLAALEGGHLATVRSSAENSWLRQTFSPEYWIGFNDSAVEGQWLWSSGENSTYSNWASGSPNNNGNEDYAIVYLNGSWDDRNQAATYHGVVELPGGPVSEVTADIVGGPAPRALGAIQAAPLPAGGALSFGGETSNGLWAFTYEWTSSGWSKQVSVLNPMPRTGHSLILDEANQNNVLFGGANVNGTKLAETWTYQGGQWTYLTPATAPAARSGHAMAFDPSAGVGILFGGEDASSTALADMWSWDGTDWAELTPANLPPARSGHGIAFDRYRGRLVLFGGTDGTTRLDDVWEWDGTDWAQMTPSQPNGFAWGPSSRDDFVMAYDPRAERIVVIGGETDSGCVDDVWSWDGIGWTRHFPTSGTSLPSARAGSAAFVDAVSGELLVFGGGCAGTFSDEMWEFRFPVTSRSSAFGTGCAGTVGVPALDLQAGTRPVVGESMVAELTNLPTSPASIPFVLTGFSRTRWAGGALPLDLTILGMPGCALLTSSDDTTSLQNQAGRASLAFSLPNDPSLLGNFLYMQGAVFDRFANAQGLVMSGGLELRIGDR